MNITSFLTRKHSLRLTFGVPLAASALLEGLAGADRYKDGAARLMERVDLLA